MAARLLLVLIGIMFGMHIGMGMSVGFERTARKTLRDPLGMVLASCAVEVAAILVAPCYRLLRNRLFQVRRSKHLVALPFGVVLGAALVLAIAAGTKLLTWLVGSSVRDSMPAYVDFVLLVPAVVIATVSAVEMERLFTRPARAADASTG